MNEFFKKSVAVSAFLTALLPVWGAPPIKVAMTPDSWKTDGDASFIRKDDKDALDLKPGNMAMKMPTGRAILKDVTFRDGTIEYDVTLATGMGAGLGFRWRDAQNNEFFYLRPRPKCAEAIDCIQYAPQVKGVLLWDMFPQYQSPAPLRDGDWNHMKLVVSGRRMNVYVNGEKSPSLKIPNLEGDVSEGSLTLQGPGTFANLVVTPGAVEGLSTQPEKDETTADSRYARNWQIAPFSQLAENANPSISELPQAPADWKPISAERGGLMNVSRRYGLPLSRPNRAVVWLKTNIHSKNEQKKQVSIGWAREIWVFVNGQLAFTDKNLYQPPSARKSPDGRCSLENGSFTLPLKNGDNEVAIAVANNFYGWGFIFRLDDTKGIRSRPSRRKCTVGRIYSIGSERHAGAASLLRLSSGPRLGGCLLCPLLRCPTGSGPC